MSEFDIYTLGSGFYLEKIFNAIRLIIDGKDSFIAIMKLACLGAIVALAIKASVNNDLKAAAKWFLGVTILVSLFLTTRATVHIHDRLPDAYGAMDAPRTVQDIPWGLAFLGSITSQVGNSIAEKFDMAFSGVFVNPDYQKTGVLFGSKIVEDISKLRIADPNLKHFMLSFYKKCIVPDVNMGYKRVNGYTIKDLVESADVITFLKDRSSKARMIYFSGDIKIINKNGGIFGTSSTVQTKKVNDYISCNQGANYIGDMINYEIEMRLPAISSSFVSFFYPNEAKIDKSAMFKSVLESSYGIFIRKSSEDAKNILLQNIMINAVGDTADSYNKAYGRVTTEEMTKSAFYSVSQMAQKFVPILRAVLECLFYGVFPLILILMVTPIGLEVLKNYAFGFMYLQLWQPMYTILFCIAASWGKFYASGIDDITIASHLKIARINEEISAVAGYMLVMVPVLSLFITKGMVSSMGNLASSIFYIPQSTAVQNAEAAIKGNYQIGTTAIDTHSFNTSGGNKHDDNYSWMGGMKSFGLPSGASERMFADGRSGIDSSSSVSNLAGLAKVDWNKAIGSRFDQSINENMSRVERSSSSMVESAASGYSKLLGFNEDFSHNSSSYQNWQNSLSADQRTSLDETRGLVNKFAEEHNISQQDALKVAVATNAGISSSAFGTFGISANADGSTSVAKTEAFNKAMEATQDKRFAKGLSKVQSFTTSGSDQEGNTIASNMLESAKSDFSKSHSANIERSQAFEKVKSLNESKSAFEQSSGSISQDLSNQFAEAGIKEYGARQFEEIIRNNPALTNQLLNRFLDNSIAGNHSGVAEQINNQKTSFNDRAQTEVALSNQNNKHAINQSYAHNQTEIKSSLPANFEKNIRADIQQGSAEKKNITASISNMDKELPKQVIGLDEKMSKVQKTTEEKTSQSATERLVDAWNPFKKE